MSDNRLIRGPNSASLITQWHDVAVATVGVMIHEEFGQLNVAKLQTECLAKYESLMDHSEMVKLYPQFAEEVAEKQWVSPISNTVKSKAETVWAKWNNKPGVLFECRNNWGPEWARHNVNGPPSGKDREIHVTEFRRKCYATAYKQKTDQNVQAECAAWKNWYPSWWKVFLIFGPGSEKCHHLFAREMSGGTKKTVKPEGGEGVKSESIKLLLKKDAKDENLKNRQQQRDISNASKSGESSENHLSFFVKTQADNNSVSYFAAQSKIRETKTNELKERIALYTKYNMHDKAERAEMELMSHLESSPPKLKKLLANATPPQKDTLKRKREGSSSSPTKVPETVGECSDSSFGSCMSEIKGSSEHDLDQSVAAADGMMEEEKEKREEVVISLLNLNGDFV